MSKNILNKSDKESLQKRLNQLSIESERKWVKMIQAQILWHLRSQLELALGVKPT